MNETDKTRRLNLLAFLVLAGLLLAFVIITWGYVLGSVR